MGDGSYFRRRLEECQTKNDLCKDSCGGNAIADANLGQGLKDALGMANGKNKHASNDSVENTETASYILVAWLDRSRNVRGGQERKKRKKANRPRGECALAKMASVGFWNKMGTLRHPGVYARRTITWRCRHCLQSIFNSKFHFTDAQL